MKISAYQSNAQMLKECQRVLHQQHLDAMKKLNMEVDHRRKVEQVKTQWVKPNSVDVMV